MTAMLKQFQSKPPPAQVKAVEEICVTCGGAHPYYQCLAAGGNTFPEYKDNIQGYVSAAASNYNQGNPGYRPQGVANQMRPLGMGKPVNDILAQNVEVDAHIGYNCPSKVPVISNPEPCNNQTIDELPQTLPIFHPTFHSETESPFTLDSTPTYVDESPNVFNPPSQPPVYPCKFCGNDAYYGHCCTPQAPFIYPEPCYNQDFNFPQDFQNVPQQ
nr:hypothetical protein [Tanacetum cinerariifolium]